LRIFHSGERIREDIALGEDKDDAEGETGLNVDVDIEGLETNVRRYE
tara:strand:+ start:425 stop:565 length:141 start_codon:yes stop_codon:yes gene_type:complete